MLVEKMPDEKDLKNDPLLMRPILALRNGVPFNCLEVYEKCKKQEMQHAGDFKYLMDYTQKILKWHQRAISRPEVARYNELPNLQLPVYIARYFVITEMCDKNYALQEAQRSLLRQFCGVKSPAKTKAYFQKRDKEFVYEKNVANHRESLAKSVKKIASEMEVDSIEDNQYLLYHRAVQLWKSIQEQAQAAGDVSPSKSQDISKLFPIQRFSQILVDTPPLPIPAKYDQLVADVAILKQVLIAQNKQENIERIEADMVVAPSERHTAFGYPPKWRKIERLASGSSIYP
ncbi:hypothetical protein M3Y97_00956600 [Aphelenchoides bicaudatus]|nr:hypothetical protein M3Y97_00956600 [Aphelenchoides bicaudatus]